MIIQNAYVCVVVIQNACVCVTQNKCVYLLICLCYTYSERVCLCYAHSERTCLYTHVFVLHLERMRLPTYVFVLQSFRTHMFIYARVMCLCFSYSEWLCLWYPYRDITWDDLGLCLLIATNRYFGSWITYLISASRIFLSWNCLFFMPVMAVIRLIHVTARFALFLTSEKQQEAQPLNVGLMLHLQAAVWWPKGSPPPFQDAGCYHPCDTISKLISNTLFLFGTHRLRYLTQCCTWLYEFGLVPL